MGKRCEKGHVWDKLPMLLAFDGYQNSSGPSTMRQMRSEQKNDIYHDIQILTCV